MTNPIIVRAALKADHDFILSLSPCLSEVANLSWHKESTVEQMQDKYMLEMLNNAPEPNITLIAEKNGTSLGFINVCSHKDGISNETCGTVSLLAVAPNAQKMGVGQLLMDSAEEWAKNQGYSLLHLEVFANNKKAQRFYQHLGFEDEMQHMVKPLY
jgi:ribosomal protein S18 acetylase RimI-like enzyme